MFYLAANSQQFGLNRSINMPGEPYSPGSRTPGDHAYSPERAWRVFARLIKAKHLRITQARRLVFDEGFSRHDHFAAD